MKTGDWGVVNWFIRKILAGETIHIYGDGSQIRDYNYVDDVCDALILAAQSEKSNGEMFLLGTGSGMKFIDMVKTLIKVAGTGNYQLVEFPNDRKAIDIKKYVADIGKIKHALGWTPSTDFESGVRKTVEFYRKELRNYM
jgi:dTDP-D-glucose 4,6-dehydratase